MVYEFTPRSISSIAWLVEGDTREGNLAGAEVICVIYVQSVQFKKKEMAQGM